MVKTFFSFLANHLLNSSDSHKFSGTTWNCPLRRPTTPPHGEAWPNALLDTPHWISSSSKRSSKSLKKSAWTAFSLAAKSIRSPVLPPASALAAAHRLPRGPALRQALWGGWVLGPAGHCLLSAWPGAARLTLSRSTYGPTPSGNISSTAGFIFCSLSVLRKMLALIFHGCSSLG